MPAARAIASGEGAYALAALVGGELLLLLTPLHTPTNPPDENYTLGEGMTIPITRMGECSCFVSLQQGFCDSLEASESTVGQPMAVCRQGIYVEYSVEYLKCRALNGILVSTVDSRRSTVDDCRLLN
eukprot:9504167-Pyramimonas_sp.AAC.4